MKKKSIIISLALLICIGSAYAIYSIDHFSDKSSSKMINSTIQTNNIKTEQSPENLHTTASISNVQQSNNENQVVDTQQSNNKKEAAGIQQSNNENQVANTQRLNNKNKVADAQQSNNEKQQDNNNSSNLLGIYYSSKIVGENKFYGDNTLVLTNNLYTFNGTNISNPIYYVREVSINNLTTSSVVGNYFGQNTQFKIIIPVPNNASNQTINNYISFALAHPSNFPCIGNNELIVFNSYKGAVILKK